MIEYKWQPIMLITDKQLDCVCGAMAIFVVLEGERIYQDDGKRDCTYAGWCQTCFKTAQENEGAE